MNLPHLRFSHYAGHLGLLRQRDEYKMSQNSNLEEEMAKEEEILNDFFASINFKDVCICIYMQCLNHNINIAE